MTPPNVDTDINCAVLPNNPMIQLYELSCLLKLLLSAGILLGIDLSKGLLEQITVQQIVLTF